MKKTQFSRLIAGTMTWGVWGKNFNQTQMIEMMNICLENLSLTKNGNDFGIDGISFRKCDAAQQETFDRNFNIPNSDQCEKNRKGRGV